MKMRGQICHERSMLILFFLFGSDSISINPNVSLSVLVDPFIITSFHMSIPNIMIQDLLALLDDSFYPHFGARNFSAIPTINNITISIPFFIFITRKLGGLFSKDNVFAGRDCIELCNSRRQSFARIK